MARRQLSIIRAPNTLCIQLTRFARGRDALKVQTVVEAPHNLQLLGFIDYDLVATMDHKGSTIQSGHYISKVRDPDGSWKLYDDTRVSTISHWGVVSKDNYFLMYRRKSSLNTLEAPTLELLPDEIVQVCRGLYYLCKLSTRYRYFGIYIHI
jgi:ubiquitin C-terminal hydrolase